MDNAAIASVGQDRVETTSGYIFKRPMPRPFATQETSESFDEWFSRCHGSLHFTACRVLGDLEGAELAVQNCWLAASRNPPTFDREGAFRSWLLRVLIDEASAILQRHLGKQLDHEHAHPPPLPSSSPSRAIWHADGRGRKDGWEADASRTCLRSIPGCRGE
jgi:DNA-directed RNA polymerase specialized sigma24 family protein